MAKQKGSIIALEDKPNARCRHWQLRISIGKDYKTGKYITKTHRMQGTYTEAQEALKIFANQVIKTKIKNPEHITYNEAAKVYVEARKLELSSNTVTNIKIALKNIGIHIGKIPLEKITKAMIEDARTALLKGETASGKPLSTVTTVTTMTIIHRFFEWCIQRNYIDENPTEKLPSIKRKQKAKKALAVNELASFLKKLDGSNAYEMALIFYASMGLRRAEALELTWGNIDTKKQTLSITKSKTQAGRRTLPIPTVAQKALQSRAEKQKEADIKINKNTPICDDGVGRPLKPSRISYWWPRHQKEFNLDGYTLHELRHSYATALASCGIHPRIMQTLLGHENPDISLKVYAHVNMDLETEAVEIFNQNL